MIKKALVVRIEAKPGKEAAVRQFLLEGLPIIEGETQTPVWFALHLGGLSFGIFDAFQSDSDRKAHLAGDLAALLMEKTPELFSAPPLIENADVLAQKVVRAAGGE